MLNPQDTPNLKAIRGLTQELGRLHRDQHLLRSSTGFVVEADVERLVQNQPRFLFRAWKPNSGGPLAVNTSQNIIPAFFNPLNKCYNKSNYPSSYTDFYKFPRRQLELKAKLHLRTVEDTEFHSCFSSWTQDLFYALFSTHANDENLKLSVLDTASRAFREAKSPVLSAANLAKVTGFSTETFRQAEADGNGPYGTYPHESLAFGPINEPAFQTVSCKDLVEAGVKELLPPSSQYKMYGEVDEKLPYAKACGRLFGPIFGPAVMAHFMGIFEQINGDHEKVVAGLSSEMISDELRDFPAVNLDDVDYEDYHRPLRGDYILRDVVIGQFPGQHTLSTIEDRADAEKWRDVRTRKQMDSGMGPYPPHVEAEATRIRHKKSMLLMRSQMKKAEDKKAAEDQKKAENEKTK